MGRRACPTIGIATAPEPARQADAHRTAPHHQRTRPDRADDRRGHETARRLTVPLGRFLRQLPLGVVFTTDHRRPGAVLDTHRDRIADVRHPEMGGAPNRPPGGAT
ncbi:hypothetical protein J4H86_01420 [Spiractinospora alimapuensis]|uniref:hypothetical protein n=1 Tax=Spiractinospora alimapuensis TaxID=2820884 RepID=UPI001F3CEC93|nr:hypothetical protein [Spiractinospora alimapuensis]QVQ52535.1 hypothetical protein J4H86_01420 [Spiractinospora alimapuensis]